MKRYAQINEQGLVVSDSHLCGEITAPHMIPIADDFDLMGKKYENGEWVDYEPEYVEVEEPMTQLDIIEANTTYIAMMI